MASRRQFPSLSILCAFEAAARTQSITAAGRELSLTQSAVSRQVLALETQLGVTLFARQRQAIKLTPEGRAYADEVRQILAALQNATAKVKDAAARSSSY